jgi:superfamily II DNA/RNA helicase
LHRVGRTGRHNDKGVALTLGTEEEISKLTEGVKKIHKIEMIDSDNMKEVSQEVFKCI